MKMPTYREALKMGEKKLKEVLIPIRVSKAKKQAELEMCKLEEKIAVLQADIQEACCKEEVNFPNIIELQDKLGLLERKLKQYKKIIEEMFPE